VRDGERERIEIAAVGVPEGVAVIVGHEPEHGAQYDGAECGRSGCRSARYLRRADVCRGRLPARSGDYGWMRPSCKPWDDGAQLSRRQQPLAQRARAVHAHRRESPQSIADPRWRLAELPLDLGFYCCGFVWGCHAGGLGRVRGGTQRVRSHVADGCCLAGGAGRGRRGGLPHLTRAHATGEPTTDLLGSFELLKSRWG
jgi:hypothetical protein